jgi:hypothetical protein
MGGQNESQEYLSSVREIGNNTGFIFHAGVWGRKRGENQPENKKGCSLNCNPLFYWCSRHDSNVRQAD